MYVNDPDLEYLTQIQQTDLSFYDKAELNAFYQCAGVYWSYSNTSEFKNHCFNRLKQITIKYVSYICIII